MTRVLTILAACLLIAAPLTASAQQGARPVNIEDPWVRLFKDDGAVTLYFTIDNPSDAPDRLLEVSTPAADAAGLYRTAWQGLQGVGYERIAGVEIGGFDRVDLKPGGIHVRLEGVRGAVRVGQVIPFILTFERSGPITINAQVANRLLGDR